MVKHSEMPEHLYSQRHNTELTVGQGILMCIVELYIIGSNTQNKSTNLFSRCTCLYMYTKALSFVKVNICYPMTPFVEQKKPYIETGAFSIDTRNSFGLI